MDAVSVVWLSLEFDESVGYESQRQYLAVHSKLNTQWFRLHTEASMLSIRAIFSTCESTANVRIM
jgi:hypothetical protein